MDKQFQQELHIAFFPFMALGHMIPTLNTASLFAARGVKTTIITTPRNAPIFINTLQNYSNKIQIELFNFPALENGLPEGCENLDQAMKSTEMAEMFIKAASTLRKQLQNYLDKARPHCLVADMFFPWATECAAQFNIPRLVFHGISLFAHCTKEMIMMYKPFKTVCSDEEMFVVPCLPHEIMLKRSQIPEALMKAEDSALKMRHQQIQGSEIQCYGVIVNSFYELEPDYAEFFKKQLGRKAWCIGPVSLSNETLKCKAQKGGENTINDKHKCLKWLDSEEPNSVIYICFGSIAHFIVPQLQEIAMALENLEYSFIWVVNEDRIVKSEMEEWLPNGFEERTRGKGLVIRGWAPQKLILEHRAIGAFVTHCGWNSTLEAISLGVVMVTWPLFAEQFYNEKLVTHVLRVGIPVGSKKWRVVHSIEDVVNQDSIQHAVRTIMKPAQGLEMRNRAKILKEMSRKAMEEGGSSYCQLSSLINELREYNALAT
ncbi:unnamed protein product [Amaranthus hypochondriacus]